MVFDTCSRCSGKIRLITFSENRKVYVSHGECDCCGKVVILPQVTVVEFRRDLNEM
jgi:hypothetical protein